MPHTAIGLSFGDIIEPQHCCGFVMHRMTDGDSPARCTGMMGKCEDMPRTCDGGRVQRVGAGIDSWAISPSSGVYGDAVARGD